MPNLAQLREAPLGLRANSRQYLLAATTPEKSRAYGPTPVWTREALAAGTSTE